MTIGILRKVFGVESPRITRDAAIAVAQEWFTGRQLAVDAPVVTEHLRYWKVLARGNIKGSAWVVIDNQTGAITKSGIPPR